MTDKQREIIRTLHVKPSIDVQNEIREIIDFMKDYVKQHTFIKSLVLGISGGQDSTLLGRLAQMAVEELRAETSVDYKFYAVRLPYGTQHDDMDARDAIEFIAPTHPVTVNIKESVDHGVAALKEAGFYLTEFQKGNDKARVRMKVQFAIAANTSGVVLGTDHAAEAVTGFYTKFGDGASDLMPLFGLNKRQGRAMLSALGAPEHLITKIPTADLESDRPLLYDEEALGVTYDAIDDFLEGKEVSAKDYETIVGWYDRTQHKRDLPYNRYTNPE